MQNEKASIPEDAYKIRETLEIQDSLIVWDVVCGHRFGVSYPQPTIWAEKWGPKAWEGLPKAL